MNRLLMAFSMLAILLGCSGNLDGSSNEDLGETQQALDTITLNYTYNSSNDYVVTATTSAGATSVELFWGATSMGVDSLAPFTWTLTTGSGSLSAKATFPGGIVNNVQMRVPQKPRMASGPQTNCMSFAGKLYCMGRGHYGALGNGGTADSNVPVQGGTSLNVGKVVMHRYGGCYINVGSNQQATCWGRNLNGITGLDPAVSSQSTSPVAIANSNQSVSDIAAGDSHACFVRNGDVYCWGLGSSGQIGNGTTTATNSTIQGPVLTGVAKIAAGGDTTCAMKTNGDVYCWGRDDMGQVGNGGSAASAVSSPVSTGFGNAVDILVGYRHACAVDISSQVYCWGDNNYGELGNNATSAAATVSPQFASTFVGLNIVSLFAGRNYNTCGLSSSGDMRCIGENSVGEMGNNTTSVRQLTPVSPTGLSSGVIAGGIGGLNGMGFKAGHAYAWGSNNYGQLGDSAISLAATQLTPNQIPGF